MWPRICNVILGLWLMAAPAVLGYGGAAHANDRIVGPLVLSFAFIAISEVTRSLRWANLPLGIWLLIAPWPMDFPTKSLVNDLIVGVLIVIFASIAGPPVKTRFGGGWRAIWRKDAQPTGG